MRRALLAVLALLALAAPAVAAQARKPAGPPSADRAAERLTQQIAERYGVQVLRAEPEQENGRTVYRMVVMNPGGNFNEAYAVHTLVVDASTGELVSQFRHTQTGYALAAPPDHTPRDDGSGMAIRRQTFSKP